jgi:DNA (cytosine-5)-methyltransferase 1
LKAKGRYASKPLYSDTRAEATIERAERAMQALGKRVPFLIVYYGSDGPGGCLNGHCAR